MTSDDMAKLVISVEHELEAGARTVDAEKAASREGKA